MTRSKTLRRPLSPRRGYQRWPKHPRHWLSASPHVVAIDRRAATFSVEAESMTLGARRVDVENGRLRVTAPLVELSPSVRRRLGERQVLSLVVSGPRHRPTRRWKAHYWTTRQIQAVRRDAEEMFLFFQGQQRAHESRLAPEEG